MRKSILEVRQLAQKIDETPNRGDNVYNVLFEGWREKISKFFSRFKALISLETAKL
jgi:hypothetical protein